MSRLLDNILPFAHRLLQGRLKEGDTALDGTAGNGHDTLLLAQCVGSSGQVWAFDVQSAALTATAERLAAAGVAERVHLIHDTHERLAAYVPAGVAAAVFNFGYLPGGDKALTTQAASSTAALAAAVRLLADDGLLAAVLYPGHEAGQLEAEAVEAWAAQLPQTHFSVLHYRFTNRRNRPPYLLAVEKHIPKGKETCI